MALWACAPATGAYSNRERRRARTGVGVRGPGSVAKTSGRTPCRNGIRRTAAAAIDARLTAAFGGHELRQTTEPARGEDSDRHGRQHAERLNDAPGARRSVRFAAMELNPFDYDFHSDPYPTYAWLREEAPVYHNPSSGSGRCRGSTTCSPGLHDPATYTSNHGVALEDDPDGPGRLDDPHGPAKPHRDAQARREPVHASPHRRARAPDPPLDPNAARRARRP